MPPRLAQIAPFVPHFSTLLFPPRMFSSCHHPLQSLSYVSPQALLNALFPSGGALAAGAAQADSGGRVAAFKRFIRDQERRGGGQAVPEFPAGADWMNAPPLRLARELRGKVVVLDFWTYCW